MIRPIKLILFIILTLTIIIFLNAKIDNNDLRFYFGKDDGYIARLESICLLAALFFCIMSRHRKLLRTFVGFLVGLFSGLICYFLIVVWLDNKFTGLVYHFLSCALFILFFYFIEKIGATKDKWSVD